MKKYFKTGVSMFMLLLVILMLAASVCTAADKIYGEVTVERVVSVYDGDTFKVDIKDWPDIIGKSIGIRVYGIDTPEMKGTSEKVKKLAVKAKECAKQRLLSAKTILLYNMRRGKYFRIIAEVYVDGESLAGILINRGLAKPYYGGTRPKW